MEQLSPSAVPIKSENIELLISGKGAMGLVTDFFFWHGIACPYSVCPLYFLLLAPVFFIICPRILYCLPYCNLNILYHLPYQLFSLAPSYKSISFQGNFNSCIMLMCMKILLYFSTTYITL